MAKPTKRNRVATRQRDYNPITVPFAATPVGETPDIGQWAHRVVWTDRMLDTLLQDKVRGGKWHTLIDKVLSELNLFCSAHKVLGKKGAAGVDRQTVVARAVATNLAGGSNGNNTGCLYTLGPPSSSIEGVNINGSATLNAPTCGIVDNGNYNSKGNKLDINAGTFGVSGSANVSGPGGTVTCGGSTTNCPTYGMPASSDPMGSMTPPCTSPCNLSGSAVSIKGANGNFTVTGSGGSVSYSNGVYTVQPGVYSSFSINGGNIVFSPGLYIFDGNSGSMTADNLTIPGNSTITGDGVTFYFTNDATIQMNGTPTINLTAPTSGTYQGILMWQDRSDTNVGPNPNGPTLGGNSGAQYNGILYFPSDQLTFYGNNNSLSVGVVVSDSLALSGNPSVSFNGAASVPGGLPPGFTVGNAHLVE